MGTNWLVATIEGDVIAELDRIAEAFAWRRTGTVSTSSRWEDAEAFIYKNESPTPERPLGACVVGGWTVLLEKHGEFCRAIFNDLEKGQELARNLRTRIFATYTTSVAGIYAYRLLGSDFRRLVWVGEEGTQDEGPKIPGEPDVDPQSYNEDCLVAVMELLGFDIVEGVETADRYVLTRLSPPWVIAGVPQFSD